MPDTIRERCIAAVEGLLAASGGVGGATVERNRDEPVTRFPTIVVVDGAQDADEGTTQVTRYTLSLDIEGWVSAKTGKEAGQAANALYGAVVARLKADPSLGGVAIDLREGRLDMLLSREEGGKPTAGFNLAVEVDFATAYGDPTALGPL